jgi:hypothetical protein
MQLFFRIVATALALVVLHACVPGLKTAKNAPNARDLGAQAAPNSNNPSMPGNPGTAPDGKSSGGMGGPGESPLDFRLKDEITRSALEFAEKNVPNVKHAKVCFSQTFGGYGGWYLIAYVQRGKKISFEQYSWNKAEQQWELVYRQKELPPNQLEFHLKGEVGDEKCFVLK